jgi:hypothetical protein
MSINSDHSSREWISFTDKNQNRTWLLDVTFLTSNWSCIYGNGCQGVLTEDASSLIEGCCSYGAFFVDSKDVARVLHAAKKLSEEDWQFKRTSDKSGGPIKSPKKPKESATTKLREDACIFLNRPGFTTGPGCALHQKAIKDGVSPMKYKPEVCWQLPLRVEDLQDASGHITTRVTSWERKDWGAGGNEFHWWCTEDDKAYMGKEPVHIGMEAELTALIGREVLEQFRKYLNSKKPSTASIPKPVNVSRKIK